MPPKDRYNQRKDALLGMPHGTAYNRLRKALLYHLAVQAGLTECFRCKRRIESSETLSIEHKVAWQGSANPRETFFDLDNIAFSHLSCNVAAASYSRPVRHGAYSGRCKCDVCRRARRRYQTEWQSECRAAGKDKSRRNYRPPG